MMMDERALADADDFWFTCGECGAATKRLCALCGDCKQCCPCKSVAQDQLKLAIETTEIALRYTVDNGGNRDYFRGCLVALYYVRDTPDWIEATKLVDRLIVSWEANNVT